MGAFWGGGGGGGGGSASPGATRNYVVADDTEAAALTALRKGDTVRIADSGASNEVKWWQITADAASFAVASKAELASEEARDDSTTILTAADETARLALADKYSPFRIVKQTDTDELWMQTANPASSAANWSLISGAPTYTLQDGGDTLQDGGDNLIER
jgi:hypothetical protein